MGAYKRFHIRIVPILVISCIMIVVITLLFLSPAKLSATGWSWVQSGPTIANSTRITGVTGSSSCSHQYSLEKISGKAGLTQVCKSKDGLVSMGWYYAGDHFEYVIGFGEFGKMFPFHNSACERYDSCIYVPQTDTLVARLSYGSYNGRSLAIYDHFSKRAYRIAQNNLLSVEYGFDISNPTFTLKNSRDVLLDIGGVGVSDNGRWLAVELKQRGIGLINLDTFEARRISTHHFEYGFGRDPTSELAVTGDGQYVSVMGSNAGIALFQVTQLCSELITDLIMYSPDYMEKPCQSSPINRSALIENGFLAALHPHFESDGAELQFYVQSNGGEQREILLRAAGYEGPRMDYLALGDSFSSGEGETQDQFYLNGTNVEFEKCHVSTRSYPYLIAQSLGIEEQYIRNVACSGAKMEDVVGDDLTYGGQAERLTAVTGLRLNRSQKALAQTAAKNEFIPGRVHQEVFVKRYQPRVITIGIGGNDAGLMQKLRSCVGPGECEWAMTSSGKKATAIELQSIFKSLVNTYTRLHDSSPGSKIYVIGYPNIIDPEGSCGALDSLLISKDERVFMKQAILYLNQVVSAAAKRAGVTYIDIEQSLEPQTLCGLVHPSVMNGVQTGDDNTLSDKADWLKIIGQESFHPQPKAHTLIFNTISSVISNLMTYQACPGGETLCPNLAINAPQPSEYWISKISVTHNDSVQHQIQFTTDSATNQENQIQIQMPDYSFAPNSLVRAEIHSNILQLGEFTAATSGSTSASLYLPQDLEQGFHTIHLLGTDFAGDAVDYYQLIKYSQVTISLQTVETISQPEGINVGPPNADINVIPTQSNDIKQPVITTKTLGNSSLASSSLSSSTTDPHSVLLEAMAAPSLVNQTVRASTVVLLIAAGLGIVGLAALITYRIRR